MLINEEDNTLYLNKILIDRLPYSFKVNASLSLEGSSVKELPKGLIVNGNLDLRGSLIKEIPEDIIVTNNILIEDGDAIIIPKLLCIGGQIYDKWDRIILIDKKYPEDKVVVVFRQILSDTIAPILGKHKCEEEDTFYYTGIFPNVNVVQYKNNYSICPSLKKGLQEVWWWQAIERGIATVYHMRALPLSTELTVSEFVDLYYLCTGACKEGIDEFVSSLDNPLRKYTIAEVLELTKDKYYKNIIFEQFFLENNQK